MDPSAWGQHSAAAPPPPLDPVAPIIFTQSQIESCLLRGLSKWEIVAELQTNNQIKQSTILDVWARLESQNQPFFEAYDQFIRLRNQVQDFNDIISKFADSTNGTTMDGGASAMHPPAGNIGGGSAQATTHVSGTELFNHNQNIEGIQEEMRVLNSDIRHQVLNRMLVVDRKKEETHNEAFSKPKR